MGIGLRRRSGRERTNAVCRHTNILLYAACNVPRESDKRRRALELLAETDLALSMQVLQEFYHQATRRSREGRLTPGAGVDFSRSTSPFSHSAAYPPQSSTRQSLSVGGFGLSYWDGAILAAARSLGCDAVYSEDLSAEQDYDGLRVINPFAGLKHLA